MDHFDAYEKALKKVENGKNESVSVQFTGDQNLHALQLDKLQKNREAAYVARGAGGLIGYHNYQLGKQEGGNLPDGTKNYRVNGIGMEFSYRTTDKWVFISRWYLDYQAINRPEATIIRFVLLKNF